MALYSVAMIHLISRNIMLGSLDVVDMLLHDYVRRTALVIKNMYNVYLCECLTAKIMCSNNTESSAPIPALHEILEQYSKVGQLCLIFRS